MLDPKDADAPTPKPISGEPTRDDIFSNSRLGTEMACRPIARTSSMPLNKAISRQFLGFFPLADAACAALVDALADENVGIFR